MRNLYKIGYLKNCSTARLLASGMCSVDHKGQTREGNCLFPCFFGAYEFCSKYDCFSSLVVPVVFPVMGWLPISFTNVEPSGSLFSLCLSSPFLCVSGILLPASATEHAEKNPSIESSLRSFDSITPLLQVLVITNTLKRTE